MKKARFALIFLCISIIMSSSVSASEVSEYYKEDFSYESEHVADVLKSATVLVYADINAEITYKPITVRTDLLVNDIVQLRSENPDVNLQAVYDYMLTQVSDYFYFSSAVTKSSTVGGQGSGVVISEDGYIATNRHVVKFSEDELKEIHLESINSIIIENCKSIISSIEGIFGEGSVTEDMLNELLPMIEKAYLSNLTISDSKISYYVFSPGPNGEANVDFSKALEAAIVDIGGDAMIEDAAIIKIDASNLVALNLINEYPNTGSDLWAAGYPTVAEISASSVLTATITSGKVSGLKDADGSSLKFIQSEAAISQGNSGGPSVNNNCNVLGLNTFAANGKDNFNFIVPYEMIDKLSAKAYIGQGDFSKAFMTGIQAMQEGYGLTATDCFQKVKEINPNIPYINDLIKRAEKLPQNKINKFDIKTIAVYGGISFVSILTLVIIILLISKSRKRKSVYNVVDYDTELELGGQLGGGSLDSGGLLTEENNELGAGGDSLL